MGTCNRASQYKRLIRLWVEKYLQNERDMFALIHKSKNQTKGRKVTYLEQQFLLKLLLTPQKVKIGTAISTIKDYERMGCLESPSSAPTLKRWVMDWKRDNMAIWTQARLGSKAVAETIVKTIIRDSSLLNVGDVWVADGHTLAFDIMNPKTGKAQRMTMIMVFDWASRYPVGASLAFTEDSQHIQIAFRNAFLNWGGVPKYVYLDNGKAFRAKLFNEKWQEHDLSSDLAGIFPRLGIQVAFAESYNAKAKVIERFFKTFQERFERFIGSFRGASIDDKPATLMRNEKWARKMYDATPPTIEEAMQMIGFFIRKMYGEAPHSGLKGKSPWSVFSANPVPEEQKIKADKLNFMMMSAVRKTLRNNGIMLNKLMYWDTELIGHIGKELLIRYDLSDLRWILVYDMQDNFICQAEVRRSHHRCVVQR
ncbi:MAG: Mu transposase C-terminal domain-containing protein [Proteiniphilum sp.]|nr:Mu transposase C-terminal domain-containing protein [Proteiniphilum sp.]